MQQKWKICFASAAFIYICFQAILDNGPARNMNNAQEIQAAGDEWADPFEISTLRRDVSLQPFMEDKTKSN